MERERATVQDRCKGHTDGTDLVHELTDLRENIESTPSTTTGTNHQNENP